MQAEASKPRVPAKLADAAFDEARIQNRPMTPIRIARLGYSTPKPVWISALCG